MPGTDSSVSSPQRQAGLPENSIQSFSPPIRRPLPAATSTAPTITLVSSGRGRVTRLREDHATGDRLQDAGHGDADILVHRPAAALHHGHGAVIQVAHTLPRLLPLLNDPDRH